MKTSVVCLAMLVLLAGVAAAADTPNFTGTWKLNVAKSDFGQMPAPQSGTTQIDHREPVIKVNSSIVGDQGEWKTEATYSTDGKETTNKMFDSDIKSTARWEGAVLVISSKGQFNGDEVTSKDKWTLSEGGKLLTRDLTFSSSQGEGSWKQVFEKQ